MFVKLTPIGRNLLGKQTTVYELEVERESIPCVRDFMDLLAAIDDPQLLRAFLAQVKARLSPADLRA